MTTRTLTLVTTFPGFRGVLPRIVDRIVEADRQWREAHELKSLPQSRLDDMGLTRTARGVSLV